MLVPWGEALLEIGGSRCSAAACARYCNARTSTLQHISWKYRTWDTLQVQRHHTDTLAHNSFFLPREGTWNCFGIHNGYRFTQKIASLPASQFHEILLLDPKYINPFLVKLSEIVVEYALDSLQLIPYNDRFLS